MHNAMQEEVRSLPGVGVRIAPMHHHAAAPPGTQTQQQQAQQSQQSLPARAGFFVAALSLFDGVLEREDGSLQEAAPGLPLHACPPLLVTPVFTELQTTKRAATAGPGGSRGSSRGAAGIRGQLRKSILSAAPSGNGGAASPTQQRLSTVHSGEVSLSSPLSSPSGEQYPGSPMVCTPTTPSLPSTPSFATHTHGPFSPSHQLNASIHGASLTLSASLHMAAPSGDGGAVTRPHAAAPTAHVALSLDAVGHACPCLSDGSSFPVQLEAKDGLEMLPHAAAPRLLLAAPGRTGGLADLCGAHAHADGAAHGGAAVALQ